MSRSEELTHPPSKAFAAPDAECGDLKRHGELPALRVLLGDRGTALMPRRRGLHGFLTITRPMAMTETPSFILLMSGTSIARVSYGSKIASSGYDFHHGRMS